MERNEEKTEEKGGVEATAEGELEWEDGRTTEQQRRRVRAAVTDGAGEELHQQERRPRRR